MTTHKDTPRTRIYKKIQAFKQIGSTGEGTFGKGREDRRTLTAAERGVVEPRHRRQRERGVVDGHKERRGVVEPLHQRRGKGRIVKVRVHGSLEEDNSI